MKHHHWTWEMAYKKWFFLRFFLLLVVLGLSIGLLCITKNNKGIYPSYYSQGEKYTKVNNVTKTKVNPLEGKYEDGTANLELVHIRDNDYALYGKAYWMAPTGDIETGIGVNEGNVKGV